jgi:hypothetical protein
MCDWAELNKDNVHVQKHIKECDAIKVNPNRQLIFHTVLHYKSILHGSDNAVLCLELLNFWPFSII